VKKPFLETTWANVKARDIVLVPWEPLDTIVKVEVERCAIRKVDGKPVVVAIFIRDALKYGQSFDPADTAYVQSRL
jgi:hypothetical protein